MKIKIYQPEEGQSVASVSYTAEEVATGAPNRPYIMSVQNLAKLVRGIAQRIEDKDGRQSFALAKILLQGVMERRSNDWDKRHIAFSLFVPPEHPGETKNRASDFLCHVNYSVLSRRSLRESELIRESFNQGCIPATLMMPAEIETEKDGGQIHRFRVEKLNQEKCYLDHTDEALGRYLLLHLHGLNFDALKGKEPEFNLKEMLRGRGGVYQMVQFKMDDAEIAALLGGVWMLQTTAAGQEPYREPKIKERLRLPPPKPEQP